MSFNFSITDSISKKFSGLFHDKPVLYSAPGRINLLGEHTDYNDGFVLPSSINKSIYFAVKKTNTGKLRLYSSDYSDYFETTISSLVKSEKHWANYLIGTMFQFQKLNLSVSGFDCVFAGDIPMGAGLSSSAALECGFAFAINHEFGFGLNSQTLTRMAQKAEHEFAGLQCGIMDQFASVFGKENKVIRLDCRNLEYEYFAFPDKDADIILCDSKVKHTLASSEYNVRRQECETGIAELNLIFPEIKSLRDVTEEMLSEGKHLLTEKVFRRCHFVVSEILRVQLACDSLNRNDLSHFGILMNATHKGLSQDYEVSCSELDILADTAQSIPEVYGSRMMGGGFGGCTINLLKKGSAEQVGDEIRKRYFSLTGNETVVYSVSVGDGARKI